jgi:hypothetical protein
MINPILAQAATNQASSGLLGFGFVFLALGLLFTVLWVYALINAATRNDLNGTERILWIVLLLFLPGIGLLLYFLLKGRGR